MWGNSKLGICSYLCSDYDEKIKFFNVRKNNILFFGCILIFLFLVSYLFGVLYWKLSGKIVLSFMSFGNMSKF